MFLSNLESRAFQIPNRVHNSVPLGKATSTCFVSFLGPVLAADRKFFDFTSGQTQTSRNTNQMLSLSLGRMIAVLLMCVVLSPLHKASVLGQATSQAQKHSSLRQGDSVGVFYVTKVAGAEHDGVLPGEQLCYRCRYGSSPMVMVFARRTGGRVTELVKRIDKAVFSNRKRRLKGLVTIMGDNSSAVKEAAGKVAAAASVEHVPVVVAKEVQTGPLNYKLQADADVTIVVAKDSQVVKTHMFTSEKVDIAAIMNEVERILE
nr:hypothetical protein [Rubripirellula sp.]